MEGPNRVKLTQANALTITPPAGKGDAVLWDLSLPNFGLRLRGNTRRWLIQYRVGQQQRREILGDPRKINIDAARKIARHRFAQAELGIDPGEEKKKAVAEATAAKLTLGVLSDRYLEAQTHWAPRTREQATHSLREHWKPLRNQAIASIKRIDVSAQLQLVKKERGSRAAKVARSVGRAMFSWGMAEGWCDHNPIIGTRDPAAGSKPRERVFDDDEIKNVFACLGDDDFSVIVRLLAFTGMRRTEAGGLRWDEINFDTGVLTVSGERTKNKRVLRLTLPKPVLEKLQATPHRDGAHVFGDPNAGFLSWSHHKKLLDERLDATGTALPPWSLHDLRRTFRSGLGRLGVPPHIAELVIGHVKTGLIAVYDKYTYAAESADALQRWCEHLTAVVEDRKGRILPLRRNSE
jgi:integrase